MKKIKIFAFTTGLAALSILLEGCTPRVWLKNGERVGQAEFDRDSIYCLERSVNAFPPVTTTVVLENKKYVDRGRQCAYNPQTFRTECGDTVEVVAEKTQQRDANEQARENYKWTCMGALGWAIHEVKKEQNPRPFVQVDSVGDKTESVNAKKTWCPEIDSFCDTKSGAPVPNGKIERKNSKRDWCPDINNFCDTK